MALPAVGCRNDFRCESLSAYMARSDAWGHVCARSRLDPLLNIFGDCACDTVTVLLGPSCPVTISAKAQSNCSVPHVRWPPLPRAAEWLIVPNPLPPLASPPALPPPVIREKSQFRAQHDSLSLSLRSCSTSLYLHFRALGRPFLWAAYFSPLCPSPPPLRLHGWSRRSRGPGFGLRGCVGQALTTEAIAEYIRRGGLSEAESNIDLLDLASTPAAADWDASFAVERINL
jgi:hypothetical protein